MITLFGGVIKSFASSHWFSPSLILSFILKFESEVKQPTLLFEQCRGRGGGTGIATASFITFNTSHISLRSGLSACNNCLSPKVPPSDRLVALNLIQSFVEPLDMIAVWERLSPSCLKTFQVHFVIHLSWWVHFSPELLYFFACQHYIANYG